MKLQRGKNPNAAIFTLIFTLVALITTAIPIPAGPPFVTDDPEPVDYRHGEVYLASQITHADGATEGTAPHIEINYGALPEVQLHLIARWSFNSSTPSGRAAWGPGDLEFGVKYRFIDETSSRPQIGIFPIIEAPAGDSSKGLGLGAVQVFLPLWLQKSFGPWATYGGGGYSADVNKPWYGTWLFGWEVQRDFGSALTIGGELFTLTSQQENSNAEVAFTIGAIVNVSEDHHVLLSAGRDLAGATTFALYAAYQYTFGPAARKAFGVIGGEHRHALR